MSKITEELQAARAALAAGDVTSAFDRLAGAGRDTFQVEPCPGCGATTDVLVKSGHTAAECSKCGASWGKRSSGPIGTLVKSVRNHAEVKDMSYSKGRPEVEAKLWELWRTSDGRAVDAYEINSYSASGVIRKSLLEAIGIKVPTQEELLKTAEPVRKSEEENLHGLNKSEVLNLMFEMFKSGEAHQFINRHSMTKFDQFGFQALDVDTRRVILRKAGKDPDALAKAPVPKLDDQDGIDAEVQDPGKEIREEPRARFGYQQKDRIKDVKGIGDAKLKQLVFDNPANGEADGLQQVGKGKGDSVAKTGPGWTDKNERQYQHIKESELDAGKSSKTAKRIAAATVNSQKSEGVRPDLQKAAVDVSQPAPAPATDLGHHFIFSAENPGHPDKVAVKAGHDQVLHGLRRNGMDAREVKGKYGGVPERSIMVRNPDPHQVIVLHKLAGSLGQESALHSDGTTHRLYFYHGPNAGKYHEGKGTEWMSHEPEDAYTEMTDPDSGKRSYFRHNLDFDKLHDHVDDGSKAAGVPQEAAPAVSEEAHAAPDLHVVKSEAKAKKPTDAEKLSKAVKSLTPAPTAPKAGPNTLMKKPMAKGIAGPKPGTASAPKPSSSAKAITTPVSPKGMVKAISVVGEVAKAVAKAPGAPSFPGNAEVERKQSAEPEASVHSLTPPKPAAPAGAPKLFDPASIGIGAGGKKMIKPIKKSEAMARIEAKIEALNKSAEPSSRMMVRKYAELYTKVSLMKGDEVLLDEGE